MKLALGSAVVDVLPGAPLLMGIVNATPDSFSDRQGAKRTDELRDRGLALAAAGASIIDVGGESGRTDRAAVSEAEEIARIVPVIEALTEAGLAISVDTWRAGPAAAALAAGAVMVNDVSGLADTRLAGLCAEAGAALVIAHTRVAPKTKAFPAYDDVVADVRALLADRIEAALSAGLRRDALVLDPGIDLAKTPVESVELLRRLGELAEFDRPLLLAISRKDFVGAITGRPPRERGAGTLAAIEPALEVPAAVLRMHDVAAAADFIAVRAALRGGAAVPALPLADELRREPGG